VTDEERNTIAVGLDGSPAAAAALHWAAAEAERRRAPLRLVHARPPMPTPDHAREGVEEQQARAAQELVDGARDDVLRRRPGIQVEGHVLAEEPEDALLRVAAESLMLVLGSYGARRLPSFFLGGTSLATVARAERPVVLVRTEEDPDERGAGERGSGATAVGRTGAQAAGGKPGAGGNRGAEQSVAGEREVHPHGPRVVVALGVDHSYENLLRFAFGTAEATGLPLHVVHAIRLPSHVYVPGGPVVPHMAVEHRKEVEREVREMVRPWAERHRDVRIHASLRLEGTAQAVVHEAEGSDLLVVGRCRKHRTALGPRIGPVAHAAVHHAACPVAVVPHD
jgi:nucleotide-binding universal stress UspA family protein